MHAPSLGRRVVVSGVAVVAVLSLCLDALLYVSLRSSQSAELRRDLAREVSLVEEEAFRVGTPIILAGRLRELGVVATLRDRFGKVISDSDDVDGAALEAPVATRRVELQDGVTAEVAVSRADADRVVRRLLVLEGVATPLVVLLALLLLRLIAEIALRPLDRIAAAARRTAEGHRGERLRPQPTDTRLGQMASAYDEMLDALETAVGEAETARAESERLLARNRRIIETAREAFVAVDDAGVIVDWNTEAERIFGWTRKQALGRPVEGTVAVAGPQHDGGDGLEPFRPTDGVERSDRVVNITAVHRDGYTFPARMTVWTTCHEGHQTVSAFIWDVTEQLRHEEAVARLAAVVESADDAMFSTDVCGSILTWNAAAERMFGFAPAEAIGRNINLIVPEEVAEEADRTLQAVLDGRGVQRLETLRKSRNGIRIEVALTISPVHDITGAVCGASSVARDITEERWIALQLDQSLRALEAALADATASESDTRRFLDDAAHQLRAPLTSIRACAEGLLRTTDPGARDELLGAVVRETSRAGRLMTGLLRLARLNHGQSLVPLPCDLVQLCQEEADRVQLLSPEVRVIVAQAGVLPVERPRLDRDAVAEIVANLLDNARRHCRGKIDVVVSRTEGWVDIEIADDGLGLPAELVESAFDRFVSLDGKGGSGLGLPIARELARAQGGDLRYVGNSFVVRLPRVARGTEAIPGAGGRPDRTVAS